MNSQKIDNNTEKVIIDAIEELINKMGLSAKAEIKEIIPEEQGKIICNIESLESNFLIGQYGANLQALQHIARLIIRRKIENRINFILDVNSYRQEKDASVISLAKNMAQQALHEKKAVPLRPMPPYERRLVHLELAKNNQVKTESIGENEERRIVIKPLDLV